MYRTYGELSRDEIEPETRKKALKMVAHCCKEIGLGSVSIRWFLPVENSIHKKPFSSTFINKHDQLRGLVRACATHEIWVRAHQLENNMLETVAHECAHLVNTHNKSIAFLTDESLADEFAEDLIRTINWGDDSDYLSYLENPNCFVERKHKT